MGSIDTALQAVSLMAAQKAVSTSIIAVKSQLNTEKQVVQLVQAASNGRGQQFDVFA